MNLTNKEKLKIQLWDLGYTARQVSISERPSMYDTKLIAKINQPDVNIKLVKNALESFDKLDRCVASGEVLHGGNVYTQIKLHDRVKEYYNNYFNDTALFIQDRMKYSKEECTSLYFNQDDSNAVFLHNEDDTRFSLNMRLNNMTHRLYIYKNNSIKILTETLLDFLIHHNINAKILLSKVVK